MSRRRRGPFGFFDEVFDKLDEVFHEFEEGALPEGAGGYSVTVTYDEGGRPVVKVEAHGNVDKDALRRELERRYPGARIVGLGDEKRVRFVDEEPEAKGGSDKRGKGFRIKVE